MKKQRNVEGYIRSFSPSDNDSAFNEAEQNMLADMLIKDSWAILISFFYVALIIVIAKKLREMGVSSNLLRELTHMVMGVWPILWLLFTYKETAFIVPLIVTIMLALAPEKIRRVFSQGDEKHIGLVFYAFSFTVITFFFWKSFAGAAGIFCLSFGDGLGGLIGSRFGRRRYKIPWVKEKSLEGSLTIFVVSLVSIIAAQILYPPISGLSVVLAFVGAIFVTILEAISPYHSDNLTIPLLSAPFLAFMINLL